MVFLKHEFSFSYCCISVLWLYHDIFNPSDFILLMTVWVLSDMSSLMCIVRAQLCPTLCHPMDCSLASPLCPWDFPGKNTGVGCHFLLQGIFLTRGSNPCLLHCRWILYCWAIHWGNHHWYLTMKGNIHVNILSMFLTFQPLCHWQSGPCRCRANKALISPMAFFVR